MTGSKPARNRRSVEQMLVDLKQRLHEISDLNAVGDVLNWDQATYMPEGGATTRGRQLATLHRKPDALLPSLFWPWVPLVRPCH
jgi:Zn-dependent M32 family carboxypeptidase